MCVCIANTNYIYISTNLLAYISAYIYTQIYQPQSPPTYSHISQPIYTQICQLMYTHTHTQNIIPTQFNSVSVYMQV